MPKQNRARRKRVHEETFSDQARLCRLLPCAVPGCSQPSEPAHVRSRGAGGKDKDVCNLCHKHHRLSHDMGIRSFEAKFNLNLEVVAGYREEETRNHRCVDWLREGRCAVCLKPASETEGPA